MKAVNRKAKSNGQGQGMNWIRPEKRLAIYLRDGLACCYCGESVENGAKLTLDHIIPHSQGGKNDAINLVTACHRCNSSRGDRTVYQFAEVTAAYLNHGVKAASIEKHVYATKAQPIDVKAAKALIARRGGFTAALSR